MNDILIAGYPRFRLGGPDLPQKPASEHHGRTAHTHRGQQPNILVPFRR